MTFVPLLTLPCSALWPVLAGVWALTGVAMKLGARRRSWEPLTIAALGALLSGKLCAYSLFTHLAATELVYAGKDLIALGRSSVAFFLAGAVLGVLGALRAYRSRTTGALLGSVLLLQSVCLLLLTQLIAGLLHGPGFVGDPVPPISAISNSMYRAPGGLSVIEPHFLVRADGRIEVGEPGLRDGHALDDRALEAQARRIAEAMPPDPSSTPQFPLRRYSLLVRMDERASCAALSRIAQACAQPGVGLGKLQLAARDPFHDGAGQVSAYLLEPYASVHEQGSWARGELHPKRFWMRVEPSHAGPLTSCGWRGGPAIAQDLSPRELRAWLQSIHRTLDERWSDAPEIWLALQLEDDLPLSELVRVLDVCTRADVLPILSYPETWPTPPD